MKQFKIIVEKRPDVYVAYPLRIKGVVVVQGGYLLRSSVRV